MSLQEFQQVLSKLVISPEFCSTVRSDPERALAVFDLSQLEQQRLMIVAKDPGLAVGTTLHRSFRLSMLANTLPKTCRVLGPQVLKEVVHLYWRTEPPRGYYYVREASRFGEFILLKLQQGEIKNEFLEEILRMELATVSLAVARFTPEFQTSNCLDDPDICLPYLSAHYQIVRFHHDPRILLAALSNGQIPNDVSQGDYYILLKRSSLNQLEIKQVDPRLGKLLIACDGLRSVADLCIEFSLTVQDFELLAESGYLLFKGSQS